MSSRATSTSAASFASRVSTFFPTCHLAPATRSCLPHIHAAVHIQRVAGNVARIFGREKCHSGGNVAVCARPSQRHLRRHRGFLLVGEHCCHRRLNKSRGDRVHRNRPACQLLRQRFRQPDQACLRCRVVRLSRLSCLAHH